MGQMTDFPGSNFVWQGWPARFDCNACGHGVSVDEDGCCATCGCDAEEVASTVKDMPVWRGEGQDGRSVSCWRLSMWERLAVLLSGRVWLSVLGRQQPVRVDGRSPLEKKANLSAEGAA